MAVFSLPIFTLIWAILIICFIISGIWVFFSIRRSFAAVLIFDIIYLLMLEVLCTSAILDPVNTADLPFYLITFITFLLNIVLTLFIFSEWRDAPGRMNEYVWWLKIALSITGLFTILPLGLYYLKLSYLPRHPLKKKKDEDTEEEKDYGISISLPKDMAPVPSAPPRELIDRYRNWDYLGHGGFARVFRVTKNDGMQVALKVPLVHDSATGIAFLAEIQNWTKLDHKNIVRVVEYNILPLPFFEMELCESSLARIKKPVEPLRAAEFLYEVCEGLVYSHKAGIIHRDLKLSNILLVNGTCKISDWGLSRVVRDSDVTSSQVTFSAPYAAPEQVLGDEKDERTDIWQCGVVFFELVTGSLPFKGENIVEILAAIATRSPPVPSALVAAAQPLDDIILRCLKREPAERYPTVRDLQAAVAAYLKQEYTRRLDGCIAAKDQQGSEWYCSNLILLGLREGELPAAYRYASELLNYTPWLRKRNVQNLMNGIQGAISDEAAPDRDELVQQADDLVRQLREERETS